VDAHPCRDVIGFSDVDEKVAWPFGVWTDEKVYAGPCSLGAPEQLR
jgi:hypothetical protein